MAVDAEQSLIFTGAGEGEMKAWRVDHEVMASGLQTSDSGEVRYIIPSTRAQADKYDQGDQNDPPRHHSSAIIQAPCISDYIPPLASIPRCAVAR